ncbi:MAG: hypothetical protein HYZ44_11460 [Bacteroidetes bacterium]|nr:hypothetical protein [Bacteroidota bacterium]
MRKTLLPLFLLVLFSFKSADRYDADSVAKCKPYFHFDQVVHYKFVLPEDERFTSMEDYVLDSIIDNEERAKVAGIRKFLLDDQILTQLTDTTSFRQMEQFGFEKNKVPNEVYGKLNQLFCNRPHIDDFNIKMCIPVFHDLLVFKKNNKTVGYARICFGCDQIVIVGSKQDSASFGESSDFDKLKELLGYQWYDRR